MSKVASKNHTIKSPNIASDTSIKSEEYQKPEPKIRCTICNKKTGINYFECNCSTEKKFCSNHRLSHTHFCTYDKKAVQREKLIVENPIVKNSQFERLD